MDATPQLTGSEKLLCYQQKETEVKYAKLTLGQIQAICNKLGGEEGVHRFLRGETKVIPTVTGFLMRDSIEHELMLGRDVIKRLRDEGGPWSFPNEEINDDNYPIIGEGVIKVRFKLIPGEELKRIDGRVYRSDVETYLHERGMRFPNAAEALLPFARDKQLGCGGYPIMAFIIGGSRAAFCVGGCYLERYRDLHRFIGCDHWRPDCLFLAVCE